MSNLGILISLAAALLVLLVLVLSRMVDLRRSIRTKLQARPMSARTAIGGFYQYDSIYIDNRFFAIQREVPFTFTRNISGGLGMLEGAVEIGGSQSVQGEFKYAPSFMVSFILEVLLEQHLIHQYQIKHEYIQARQEAYQELIEKLKDFEYTASLITDEVIAKQIEIVKRYEGNETLGRFLLKQFMERPEITECFVHGCDFRIENFDGDENGIMRTVRRGSDHDEPDVIVKLLKGTITQQGFSLLKGVGEVVSSLKLFGKISITGVDSSPRIVITAYVVY